MNTELKYLYKISSDGTFFFFRKGKNAPHHLGWWPDNLHKDKPLIWPNLNFTDFSAMNEDAERKHPMALKLGQQVFKEASTRSAFMAQAIEQVGEMPDPLEGRLFLGDNTFRGPTFWDAITDGVMKVNDVPDDTPMYLIFRVN